MRTECPKCGSNGASYEKTHCDLILKCLCGYRKVVYTTLNDMEIVHADSGREVRLPKLGSKLRKTLMALNNLVEGTSGEITERLHDMGETYTASDVSSYLTILRTKGLVDPTTIRKGVSGGSTWSLTDAAEDLIECLV